MSFSKKDLLAVNGFNEDFIGWTREDSEFAARLFNYGLKRKRHPFVAICFHL
jgi:predicted glycosyltransferase involved in capsule biosynthesis